MQTKYFKNMFQNISQGVMYSTGVADSETKNSWVACYICAGENEESLEFKAEKAFAGCKDEVRLVAVGDGSEATIHQLMELVKKIKLLHLMIHF